MVSPTDTDFGVEVLKGFAAQVAMALLGFVGTVLFARLLGPRSYGGYELLLLVGQLFVLGFNAWSGATKKRYTEQGTDRPEILGAQALVICGGVVAGAVGVWVAEPLLVSFTGVASPAGPLILFVAGILVFSPAESLVSAGGREGLVNWLDTLRSLLTLLFQLAFVAVGWGAGGLISGIGVATLLVVPIAARYVDLTVAVPSRATVRSLWRFAKDNIPVAYLNTFYRKYDTFLLGVLLTQTVVGYYGVAFRLALPALFLTNVLTGGLMPRVSELDSRGASIAGYVDDAVSFAPIVAVPMTFGALALQEGLVVTVFGPAYRPAVPYVVGLLAYNVFRTVNDVIRDTLAGVDRQRLNVQLLGATVLLNVVLGVVLVTAVGGIGAVIATLATGVVRFLVSVVVSRRVLGVFPVTRLHAAQVLSGLVMYAVVAQSYRAFGIASWVDLLVLVGVGAVAYGGCLTVVSARLRRTSVSLLTRAGVWPDR
ncbi:MAG: lipopolysaccharide biosynthesis protein [Halobaculum sp.]